MKKVNSIFLALVAIYLLAAPLALAQGTKESGSAEKQIETLQAQIVPSMLKGDPGFFEKYYADDAWVIHGDGKPSTKAEEITNLKSGVNKYESLDVRDQKIRTYGDTAVVNSLLSLKGTVNGKPYSGDVRAIRVWVKQKGNWKVVSYSVTRVVSSK